MRAAIYARYSSENQREESIEAQIKACKEYCEKNNIEIVKIYTDEAKSATTDDRPAFLQMIRESNLKLFDVVVVHKLDRFARNRYDSAFYKRQLKKNGVKLISVLEQLDDSPESVILESVLEGMAEYYSKNLAREVMKGLKENANKCMFNGGIPPLGYKIVDGKYVVDEKEAEIVKLIFEMFANGHTYNEIINELNNRGYKTRKGNAFGKNSLHDILKNEKYTGVYVFNKGTKTQHRIVREDVIKIEGGIPAIVSKEIFEKCQERLNKNKRQPRTDTKRYYLLTDLIKCGMCGSSYSGNSYRHGRNGKKYYIYTCSNRSAKKGCKNKSIRQDLLENFVINVIKNFIFDKKRLDELIDKIYSYAQEMMSEKTNELEILEKQKNSLQTKINKLLDMYLEDGIDKEILKQKVNDLKAQLDIVQQQINELLTKDYSWITKEYVREYLNVLENYFESEDMTLKRKVIEIFIEEIIINENDLEVKLKVDMDRGNHGSPNKLPKRRKNIARNN